MVLSAALALPAMVGALLVIFGSALGARPAGWVAGAAAVGSAGLLWAGLVRSEVVDVLWVPDLGLRFALRADGYSVPFVLLTSLVLILVVAHTAYEVPPGGSAGGYLGCVLLVGSGALTAFLAGDMVLFFLAFEVVLIPMWVLIGRWGDPHDLAARRDAASRFLLYTAVGSTLMLVGILLLAHRTGSTGFAVDAVQGTGPRAVLIVLLLVLGLAIKLPVFPLHTWLPAAHTIAPTGGSVLLAAVLLKLGSYGLIRLPVLSAPEAFAVIAPWLGLAGGVGVVWGGLVCLAESDLKRLIAYSSVAHMGFVALAVSTGSQLGITAAIYTSIAHGLIASLLFILVGGLKHRWGSASLTVAREPLREVSPRLGAILVLGLAASMGLPGLAGFWGELLTLVAAWSPAPGRPRSVFVASAIIAAVGAALAAAYVVRVLRLVWLGDAVAGQRGRPIVRVDIRGVEWAVTAVLVAGIVWLGVYPYVLLDLTVVAPAGPAVAP